MRVTSLVSWIWIFGVVCWVELGHFEKVLAHDMFVLSYWWQKVPFTVLSLDFFHRIQPQILLFLLSLVFLYHIVSVWVIKDLVLENDFVFLELVIIMRIFHWHCFLIDKLTMFVSVITIILHNKHWSNSDLINLSWRVLRVDWVNLRGTFSIIDWPYGIFL